MDIRRQSSFVMQKLGDLAECPICTDILNRPKMLQPCMHSFCLACLEHYAKGKQPGDQITCPVCRVQVPVAQGGFKSLPANHIMENIVELMRISQPERRHSLCDNCVRGSSGSAADGSNGGFRVDMYCIDCRQKLCVRCIEAHRRLKIAATHKLVKLGAQESITR